MTEETKKKRRTLDEQIADLENSRKLQLGRLLAREQLKLASKALGMRKDQEALAFAKAALEHVQGLPTVAQDEF